MIGWSRAAEGYRSPKEKQKQSSVTLVSRVPLPHH
jgi:hypothetical protein